MKMIKVAYILGKVHSGGKKNLVLEYLRHIDTSRVTIDFICDSDSNSIPTEEVEKYGGKVIQITPYQKLRRNMSDIQRVLKDGQYDVVHAWNSTLNVFPMYVAKKANIPVRISESLSMANISEPKTYIKYFLKPFSCLFATHFMSCGVDCGIFQFGKKAYDAGKVEVFKTVIDANANRFNPDLRTETRNKFGWNDNVVYGFIGRYVPQKNPLFIIDVFNEIQKRQASAKLVLIGFGGLESQMMQKVKVYGIEGNVVNLGQREDIKQFYNAFDAFLLPSLYEGLPVVGLEAQACGLPIFFSTEITTEAAANELGVFMSLKDKPALWSERIIPIVEKNMQQRTSRSEDIIKAGFDSKAETERLMKYYETALAQVK